MGGGRKIAVLLMALALVGVLVAGCGSSDSSSSAGSTAAADTSSSSESGSTSNSSEEPAAEESDGGEAGADNEFVRPNGKNEIALFGEEGGDTEREAASAVLEENLEARAAGDWAGQCSSLAPSVVKTVEKEAGVKGGNACAKALKISAEPVARTKEARANTMTEPVAVLRVEGNKGYALYHGAKGVDYAMPMEEVGGQWKVAALVTLEVP